MQERRSGSTSELSNFNREFGFSAELLAEIQKIYCSGYDTVSKSSKNIHSTDVWSNLLMYIETGLSDSLIIQTFHKTQAMVFRMAMNSAGAMALADVDEALKSKNKMDLLISMGEFFLANLGTPEEMAAFTNETVVAAAGVFMGYGINNS